MALGVELCALPLGFMAREVALYLFWMLQGSKQPPGPPPSHGGVSTQPQQHRVSVWKRYSKQGQLWGSPRLILKNFRDEDGTSRENPVKPWHCCPRNSSWEPSARCLSGCPGPHTFLIGFLLPSSELGERPKHS